MIRRGTLLACCLLLVGCVPKIGQSPIPDNVAAVRVIGAPTSNDFDVDNAGHASAWEPAPGGKTSVAVPVTDGGYLTEAEVASLKSAVRYAKPPTEFVGCCTPRHAFLLYDRNGRYQGRLLVCFECGCSDLTDAAGHSDARWYDWDDRVLGAIATRHHLAPLKPHMSPAPS